MGISLDCHKLGLGVADAGTRRAASATPAHQVILLYLYMSVKAIVIPVHVCKNGIFQQNLGYLSFDDLSEYIPVYSKIQQKQMGYPWIT